MGNDRNDPARWPDGVETYPAGQGVLQGYEQARQQLAQFRTPVLADGPHGRVWVACFDGTWNDKDKFPDEKTNVADIYDQIETANKQGLRNVSAGYQSGVGTQDSEFFQKLDGALGYSYGPRMEEMYLDFIRQAHRWKIEDPNAEISVAAMGFSRGGPTASMFTRMVHERGIQNPDGMVIERDRDGSIQSLTPTKPNLVPPGQTKQALGLFDPVATGEMNMVDVRPPPSVVSGFQITALHERRDLFLSKQIIDPGLSADGRFLGVQVGGAHSNIGGSYLLNGLSVRNGNMMMAYLNGLSDTPFLRERVVPTAPEMNVIHRSEQHRAIYGTLAADLTGERMATERLAAPARTPAGMVYDHLTKNMYDAEPADSRLQNDLRYRPVPVGPQREDPALPDFYRDYQSRIEERAAIETRNKNFVPPAVPLVYRDSGTRGEYDVREQLQQTAPNLTPKASEAPPKPLFEMPDYLRPDQQDTMGTAQQADEDIPTLATVQVRPGPELKQGADDAERRRAIEADRAPSNAIPVSNQPIRGERAPDPTQQAAPEASAPGVGDQIRTIATLQSGLIQLGYHRAISQPLQVNGVNDDATRQAVTAFQARNDLPITNSFDQATQQALQQMLLAQQQATEQRHTEDKAREKEQVAKEQTRSEELLPYSDPSSPQHAHRADLAQRAHAAGASLTEEQLTLGVAQLQAHNIKPGWEGYVVLRDDTLYVRQFMPPEHFRLDTRQPAPPVQETLQQAANQQREHAEELARMEAMPKIHGPTLGPGGPGGMPSMQG